MKGFALLAWDEMIFHIIIFYVKLKEVFFVPKNVANPIYIALILGEFVVDLLCRFNEKPS